MNGTDVAQKKQKRFSKGKRTNLKKFAYEEIKTGIVNCVHSPGELLNENLLAEELNISRTPIREALSQLQEEGLVKIMPKKGILVSNITIADMSQIYQTRLHLEPFVVRISGPRLDSNELLRFRELFHKTTDEGDILHQLEVDTSFHRYLADSCNNKYIRQLMNKVLDENKRVVISTKNECRVEHSHDEHLKLIELLLTKNYEEASRLMHTHIENCRDSAFQCFLNNG